MKETLFLVFNEKGFVSAKKRNPPLAGGEISVRLLVTVPSSWFNRAAAKAEVTLPELVEPDVDVVWDEVRDETVDF